MDRKSYLKHYQIEKKALENLIKTLEVFQMSQASIDHYQKQLEETLRIIEQLEDQSMPFSS